MCGWVPLKTTAQSYCRPSARVRVLCVWVTKLEPQSRALILRKYYCCIVHLITMDLCHCCSNHNIAALVNCLQLWCLLLLFRVVNCACHSRVSSPLLKTAMQRSVGVP